MGVEGVQADKKTAPIIGVFLALGSLGAAAVLAGRLGLEYAWILAVAVFIGNGLFGLLFSRRYREMLEMQSLALLEMESAQQSGFTDCMGSLSQLCRTVHEVRTLICSNSGENDDSAAGVRK
jgi:hypothetical protein